MLDKINIRPIIAGHISTLYDGSFIKFDDNNNIKLPNISRKEVIIWFGLPIVFALLLLYLNPIISEDLLTIIATTFSIFTAVLLSLLLLIHDMYLKNEIREMGEIESVSKLRDAKKQKLVIRRNKIIRKVLQETVYNISFLIVVSAGILVAILLLAFLSVDSAAPYFILSGDIASMIAVVIAILYHYVCITISGISYYLICIFILTLFMALKHVVKLFELIMKFEKN